MSPIPPPLPRLADLAGSTGGSRETKPSVQLSNTIGRIGDFGLAVAFVANGSPDLAR